MFSGKKTRVMSSDGWLVKERMPTHHNPGV